MISVAVVAAPGCVEAYIGAPALLEEWHRTDPAATPPSDPDSEEWVDRFLESARVNKSAQAALDQAAFYVGTAAANLVNLFNPEKIIIGGWLGFEAWPAPTQPDPQGRQGPGSRVHSQQGEHRGRPARRRRPWLWGRARWSLTSCWLMAASRLCMGHNKYQPMRLP